MNRLVFYILLRCSSHGEYSGREAYGDSGNIIVCSSQQIKDRAKKIKNSKRAWYLENTLSVAWDKTTDLY